MSVSVLLDAWDPRPHRRSGQWLRLRRAAASLTQRELAELSGVKQPLIAAIEVGSRRPTEEVRQNLEDILQLRPTLLLAIAREWILRAVGAVDGEDVRVIGSVAKGRDGTGSDLNLIVTFPAGADLVTLLRLEKTLSQVLSVPVTIASSGSPGDVLEWAITQATPL